MINEAAAQAMLDALRQWQMAERDRDVQELDNARRSRDDALIQAGAAAMDFQVLYVSDDEHPRVMMLSELNESLSNLYDDFSIHKVALDHALRQWGWWTGTLEAGADWAALVINLPKLGLAQR